MKKSKLHGIDLYKGQISRVMGHEGSKSHCHWSMDINFLSTITPDIYRQYGIRDQHTVTTKNVHHPF